MKGEQNTLYFKVLVDTMANLFNHTGNFMEPFISHTIMVLSQIPQNKTLELETYIEKLSKNIDCRVYFKYINHILA